VHAPGELHPAQLVQEELVPHAAQVVLIGVPEQVGPTLKRCGGVGACRTAVSQQIREVPGQSSSVLHALGQVLWQMPPQHSKPLAAQSADVVHVLGHGS
jgi:hypothetical protein